MKSKLLAIANMAIDISYDSSLRLSRKFKNFVTPENKYYPNTVTIQIDNVEKIKDENGKFIGTFEEVGEHYREIYQEEGRYYSLYKIREEIIYKIKIESTFNYRIEILSKCLNKISLVYCALGVCIPYAIIENGGVMLHSSCIVHNGKAYLFLGESGRGKSTHAKLWMENIDNTELLNDDCPAITINDDICIAHGTPWSGKTPCYKSMSAPIGGIVQINRAKSNKIKKVSSLRALSLIMPCVVGDMKWDSMRHEKVVRTIECIVEKVPVYDLWCTPTAEAAQLCSSFIVD